MDVKHFYGINPLKTDIIVKTLIWYFFQDLLINISNEGRVIQDFLVILKRMLQNYLKILKKCFLIKYYMDSYVIRRSKSSITHWCVTRHEEIKWQNKKDLYPHKFPKRTLNLSMRVAKSSSNQKALMSFKERQSCNDRDVYWGITCVIQVEMCLKHNAYDDISLDNIWHRHCSTLLIQITTSDMSQIHLP